MCIYVLYSYFTLNILKQNWYFYRILYRMVRQKVNRNLIINF